MSGHEPPNRWGGQDARREHERRLRGERERTVVRLAALTDDYAEVVEASRWTNADDEHDPEGQTIAYERSRTGALGAQTRAHLAEVDAALARLAAGTYGVCERCGRPAFDAIVHPG